MNVRVVCIDKISFEICKSNSIWASKDRRIRNFEIGDVLVIRVDGKIAGYTEVASKIYESKIVYWKNDLYPYRVNLGDWNLLTEDNWIEVNNDIKKIFMDSWGINYGLKMIAQIPLVEKQGKKLMALINMKLE